MNINNHSKERVSKSANHLSQLSISLYLVESMPPNTALMASKRFTFECVK